MKSLGFVDAATMEASLKSLNVVDTPTTEEPKRRSFGSTQFNLPDDLADRVRAMSMKIADDDLADDGREDDPHVTILYGLTDDNPKSVRQSLRGQPTGTIEFGQTSVFKCDDYDVVKIDVLGDYIEHIHDVLADDCKYESTHPTYIPHCTLAYVRSGCGKKYLGMDDMEGQSFMPNKVIFSNTQNTVTAIPLGGVVKDVQGEMKSLGLSTSTGSDGGFTVLPEHDSEIKSQFIPGVSAIGVCPICGADAVVQDESSGEVVCRNGHSFRPIQTLPIGSVTKSWITLKPHGDDEDGYVHVLLGSDGKILAGPKHMEGKKVSELGKTHEQVGEPRDTKHPEQAGQQKTKKADEDTIAAYTNGKKGEEAAAGHEVAQQSHKDAAEFHKQNGNEKQADYHDNIANVHGERAASLRGSESDSSNKPSDKPEPTQSNEQPHPTNAESDQVHLPEGEKPVPESVSAPEPKSPDVPHNDGTVPNMASEKSDETPRQAAERQQKAIDTDYEFARQSAIGNAGVDLKGSARHKRNAWRGLEDAEKDGTAAAFVTRDNLLKAEPHNLIDVAVSNPVNALAMHYAMRAFPAKPGYGDDKRRSRVSEDVNKKDRQQYVDTYREYKAKAEELARTSPGPVEALQELKKWVSNKMDDLRGIPQEKRGTFSATYSGTDMYNNTANGLVSTVSAIEASRHAPKNGAVANVDKFLKMAKESYGGDTMPTSDMLSGHVKDVIEGKSVPDTFGKKADGKGSRGFDPTQAYVAHAVRVGGRDVSHLVQDPNRATDSVLGKFGARGVQWGNSVTDDERKHHAAKLVEALSDLTDVTGIKPQDLALGNKVGWAIGARGHGTALAHYEPSSQVINLTRKSGVGCIAHEWGHAFDHSLGEFKTSLDGGNYMSANASQMKVQRGADNKLITTDQSKDPMWKGMDGVRKAVKDSGYSKRLKEVVRKMVDDGDMSKEKAKYWLANHEVFARSFEQHVQHKLGTEDRQNTYLAGLNGHPLWPTKEESAAMAPAFDGLFQAYREKHYGSPEPHKVTESEMKSLVASVVSKKSRNQSVLKSWITLKSSDNHKGVHVEINDAGEITKGPEGITGKHISELSAEHKHAEKLKPDAHAYLSDQHTIHEKAKENVRKVTGLHAGDIARHENHGRDHSVVDGFDTSSRTAARENPELGIDADAHDTPAKIWNLIREGKRKKPTANSKEVRELAEQWAKGRKKTEQPVVQHDDSEWRD